VPSGKTVVGVRLQSPVMASAVVVPMGWLSALNSVTLLPRSAVPV